MPAGWRRTGRERYAGLPIRVTCRDAGVGMETKPVFGIYWINMAGILPQVLQEEKGKEQGGLPWGR